MPAKTGMRAQVVKLATACSAGRPTTAIAGH
jgi:hypothetical protein